MRGFFNGSFKNSRQNARKLPQSLFRTSLLLIPRKVLSSTLTRRTNEPQTFHYSSMSHVEEAQALYPELQTFEEWMNGTTDNPSENQQGPWQLSLDIVRDDGLLAGSYAGKKAAFAELLELSDRNQRRTASRRWKNIKASVQTMPLMAGRSPSAPKALPTKWKRPERVVPAEKQVQGEKRAPVGKQAEPERAPERQELVRLGGAEQRNGTERPALTNRPEAAEKPSIMDKARMPERAAIKDRAALPEIMDRPTLPALMDRAGVRETPALSERLALVET